MSKAKNTMHRCYDCGATVNQHPLGRSAHDRMSIHVAVSHRKFLPVECQGAACVGIPFPKRIRLRTA